MSLSKRALVPCLARWIPLKTDSLPFVVLVVGLYPRHCRGPQEGSLPKYQEKLPESRSRTRQRRYRTIELNPVATNASIRNLFPFSIHGKIFKRRLFYVHLLARDLQNLSLKFGKRPFKESDVRKYLLAVCSHTSS